MSHKNLRPFIVKVSVLGYFPLCLKSPLFIVSELEKYLTLKPHKKSSYFQDETNHRYVY